MKNLQTMKAAIKASGLEGEEFRDEYQRQVLSFAGWLIEEIVIGTEMKSLDWKDCVSHLAHLSEIYVEASSSISSFDGSFVHHMQTLVFNHSPEGNSAQVVWQKKLFSEESAADSPETEKPADDFEIENTALLISGLLNNPNTPAPIYNAIAETVGEMFNASPQSVRASIENSPEYIEMVLRAANK